MAQTGSARHKGVDLNVTSTELRQFSSIIADRLGLSFEESSHCLDLGEILRGRMAATGARSFAEYLWRFQTQAADQELSLLAEQLTVGESWFFRHSAQFEAFVETVLLPWAADSGGRPLNLLSAGCASGEEAYTLAILVREHLPPARWKQVHIWGLDVNGAFLRKARRGCYSPWSLRDLPLHLRERYFRQDNRKFVLLDELRAAVEFEPHNFADGSAPLGGGMLFDSIFFRNVSIYFTFSTTRTVIARLTDALLPEGFLFLGHAETLRGISDDYQLRTGNGAFYYQKRRAGETPVASPLAAPPITPRPLPAKMDGSWVDTITRATERVRSLATDSGASHPAIAAPEEKMETPAAQPTSSVVARALELLREERFSDAEQVLSELPTRVDPDVLLLWAVVCLNRGKLAEARTACEQLLNASDLDAGAHYVMALLCENSGALSAAAEHDRIAIYLDSGFAMPQFHLGRLHRRAGDAVSARRQLSNARTLLALESASRVLLFGGGFDRHALIELCDREILACEKGIRT
ncbi:MAG TPA: protein-glutamate O-methyltransferase CheR [Planctomycetota bacterium]|jgi:chemotaxis protein methyltransferase CheR